MNGGEEEALPADASQMTDILDIASIVVTPWKVILAAVAFIFLLLLVTLLVRALVRFIRRRRNQIQEERLSPSELFLLETRRLDQQKLLEKGHIRKYYFFLSEALRRYLGSQFGILALDETTEEILSDLSSIETFPPDARRGVGDFLARADHVKFADLKPSSAEAAADCYALVSLVKGLSKK